MRKVLFIGPSGGRPAPRNGASAKNHHLISRFRQMGFDIKVIDTEHWRTTPRVWLRILSALCDTRRKVIVSTNTNSAHRILGLFSRTGKRDVVYWVIAGNLANWIQEGRLSKSAYRCVDAFLVEGRSMKEMLGRCGFSNALYVPNFKKIDYLPVRAKREGRMFKFVFISRILPQKGCDLIIEAVKELNVRHVDRFIVDFFGPIDNAYKDRFIGEIDLIENVSYRGFLDLTDSKNYDALVEYDAMLFPTYWNGEGFPGILIDSYIAGLPIIASNHNMNAELIIEGETGTIIPKNDIKALASKMEYYILNPEAVAKMSENCRRKAMDYDAANVVSEGLLRKIGLITD